MGDFSPSPVPEAFSVLCVPWFKEVITLGAGSRDGVGAKRDLFKSALYCQ
jgi:hypothetical protein